MAHGRTDHIQKVTELPLHFEDESGEECGDLDFRVNRPLPYNAKLVGETETAGDFSVWKYASVFDDRKGA